jgi:hypothetical protein
MIPAPWSHRTDRRARGPRGEASVSPMRARDPGALDADRAPVLVGLEARATVERRGVVRAPDPGGSRSRRRTAAGDWSWWRGKQSSWLSDDGSTAAGAVLGGATLADHTVPRPRRTISSSGNHTSRMVDRPCRAEGRVSRRSVLPEFRGVVTIAVKSGGGPRRVLYSEFATCQRTLPWPLPCKGCV